ncbi:hypothetical protein OSTOST_19301 [Ostertagia ostertagi]
MDLDSEPLEEGKFEYIDLDGNPLEEGHFNGTPPLELQSIYEDAYKANVSDDDAELAGNEKLTPHQTDLRLRSTKMFKNGTIDQLEEMIRELKSGTLYGCNGFYAGFSEELHFTVTCHHNYTDPSEFLNKTFRQWKNAKQ